MELHLWNGVLWDKDAYAYCLEHRAKLDVHWRGRTVAQDLNIPTPHSFFICPSDDKQFPIPHEDFPRLRRGFKAIVGSKALKDAKIVTLDGYQVPIAKTESIKSSDYWVKAQINDTKQGKQLVVYAGKQGADDKAQIFIDTENDKISFDQNNIHPNDVFVRLTGEFASGKKATMEGSTE